MKIGAMFSAGAFLAVLLCGGCSTVVSEEFELPPASRVLTSAESNRTIPVRVGEYVMVTLKENPTTGYSWFFQVDAVSGAAGAIEIAGERYVNPESEMPGAGGSRQVMIRAVRSGTGVLTGNCVRSWEKGIAPLTTVKYTFEVAP